MQTLRVKVSPNAKVSEVVGWERDEFDNPILKVRIQAPATEGKANKNLCAFLAKHFGVSKSQVQLQKGNTSRIKTLVVPDSVKLEN